MVLKEYLCKYEQMYELKGLCANYQYFSKKRVFHSIINDLESNYCSKLGVHTLGLKVQSELTRSGLDKKPREEQGSHGPLWHQPPPLTAPVPQRDSLSSSSLAASSLSA